MTRGRRISDRISSCPDEVKELYAAVRAAGGGRDIVTEGETLLHIIEPCVTLEQAEAHVAAVKAAPPHDFVGGRAWQGLTDQRHGAVLTPRAVLYFRMRDDYRREAWPPRFMRTHVLDADRERLGLPPREGVRTNVNRECISESDEHAAVVAARFGAEG